MQSFRYFSIRVSTLNRRTHRYVTYYKCKRVPKYRQLWHDDTDEFSGCNILHPYKNLAWLVSFVISSTVRIRTLRSVCRVWRIKSNVQFQMLHLTLLTIGLEMLKTWRSMVDRIWQRQGSDRSCQLYEMTLPRNYFVGLGSVSTTT